MNHVAFEVVDVQKMVDFFSSVFKMKILKEDNFGGSRRVWLSGGLQFNENLSATTNSGFFHHIGIRVEDVDATFNKAMQLGCTQLPLGKNWVVMPENLCIEILPLAK
jgi:catechol 2,3-dioxygenase-like lactoylglutathione lyase family enzyme